MALDLPVYLCHKRVQAARILVAEIVQRQLVLDVDGEAKIVKVDALLFARYHPAPGDYYVVYEDGYASISPKAAFEAGYSLA